MGIRAGFPGTIGNTPLIRIDSLSRATGCTILGKAEWLNPGGSIKDRAALYIVREAEENGRLEPGGTIIEGTAGNTGIGLALMANVGGYRCTVVMPETISREKIETLRALGAVVQLVPASRFGAPGSYFDVARDLAQETPGGFFANQFDNLANSNAHYETTAPELWEQTNGQLDGIVMAAGTGGTIGGVSAWYKEHHPSVQVHLIDPPGSALYNLVTLGQARPTPGKSVTEGIGIIKKTENFARARLDGAFKGSDQEMVHMAHHLLRQDGLFVGTSSALNCVGAVRLARQMGPGHIIATVLCDSGTRYQDRLYNEKWLSKEKLRPTLEGLSFLD